MLEYIKPFIEESGSTAVHLLVIALGMKIGWIMLNKVQKRFSHGRGKSSWMQIIIQGANIPVKTAIWIIGLSFALNIIFTDKSWLFEQIESMRKIGLVLCFSWFALSLVRRMGDKWEKGLQISDVSMDNNTIHLVVKLLQVLIVILSLELSLESMGFNPRSLIAIGGVGGAAVAFASQDLLSNFFGAMIIHLDKLFSVGEHIEIEDGKIKGVVDSIGWRMTNIISQEKNILYVPNSIFTKKPIRNVSRITYLSIRETICFDHTSVHLLGEITEDIASMLRRHKEVNKDEEIVAALDKISLDGAVVLVEACVDAQYKDSFKEIKHTILLSINDIISKHGAKLAHSYEHTVSAVI